MNQLKVSSRFHTEAQDEKWQSQREKLLQKIVEQVQSMMMQQSYDQV